MREATWHFRRENRLTQPPSLGARAGSQSKASPYSESSAPAPSHASPTDPPGRAEHKPASAATPAVSALDVRKPTPGCNAHPHTAEPVQPPFDKQPSPHSAVASRPTHVPDQKTQAHTQ